MLVRFDRDQRIALTQHVDGCLFQGFRENERFGRRQNIEYTIQVQIFLVELERDDTEAGHLPLEFLDRFFRGPAADADIYRIAVDKHITAFDAVSGHMLITNALFPKPLLQHLFFTLSDIGGHFTDEDRLADRKANVPGEHLLRVFFGSL